jgi:superfamily II DNA or RNA helicase
MKKIADLKVRDIEVNVALTDLDIKQEYRSFRDNVVRNFYIPILQQSSHYKRAVGFFSSSALLEIAKGLPAFIQNGGYIQLVASPYLSAEDIEAIRLGYSHRDEIIKNAILRSLTSTGNYFEKERLNILANLIADGKLDIKIAITEGENFSGMYHEKMGIFSDTVGNKVAFSGSMNETATAFNSNYESIDVFCTWYSAEDKERAEAKEKFFNQIWDNKEKDIVIFEFPELKNEIIERYKKSYPNFSVDTEEELLACSPVSKYSHLPFIPSDICLHNYQVEAINNWVSSGYRGIFDMATGAGKTFTGISAAVTLCEKIKNKLAIVIVCPYQHLVEQWVDDLLIFNYNPIIGYSASPQKDWKKRLSNVILDQNINVNNSELFCFICTNATFSSTYVQDQLQKINGDVLILVDEAHNLGSPNLSRCLLNKYRYRLALSATIERHGDKEGTQKIFDYFGKKCIEYDIERAINEGKLTRYKYYPVICILTSDELSEYNRLSHELSKCFTKDKKGKMKLNEKGKKIALARSRIVAGAANKIPKLEECITPYTQKNHILVYCGATRLENPSQDYLSIDDDDIRQIDLVTALLGNKLKMGVHQYTSKEDMPKRADIKKDFADGNSIQAIIAIKCLDEGVNIPEICTAFILASTTNPKEYIQRRGRVLRLSRNKDFSEIFDFITLPYSIQEIQSVTANQLKYVSTMVNNEIARAEEFCRLSMNMVNAKRIIDEIKSAYGLYNRHISFVQEYGNE